MSTRERLGRLFREGRRRARRRAVGGPAGFGVLDRLTPISAVFGADRGQCIDRFYIERFLSAHARDVRGRVLEVGEDTYARRFGGDRIGRCDVLHVDPDHPGATIAADLTRADHLASEAFDCIICTQTLQFIFDTRLAIRTLHRLLAPGGVLLATASGISQISRFDMNRWGDYWRFTTRSLRRALEEVFPADAVAVEAHGNVLTSIAFLHGLATEELGTDALEYRDPDYELVLTARATKRRA